MKQTITLTISEENQRLDVALATCLDLSRSAIRKRLVPGSLKLNGCEKSFATQVHAGDQVDFELKEPEIPVTEARDLNLEILYEDQHVLVINKPAGLAVHPGNDHALGVTLINGLRWIHKDWSQFENPKRLGLVHRLDKDTTGVLLIAKTLQALETLQNQFRNRSVLKEYRALVVDNIREDSITIDAPIGRHFRLGQKMAVNGRNPRNATTQIKLLERYQDACYVKAYPLTGRTHQIRVHLSHIKHPVIGDSLYGGRALSLPKALGIGRPMLHAYRLELEHPETEKKVSFQVPIPLDMQKPLKFFQTRRIQAG